MQLSKTALILQSFNEQYFKTLPIDEFDCNAEL
jgi:hypothetical protein